MIFEYIAKASGVSVDSNVKQFKAKKTATIEYLDKQEEIRVLVTDTQSISQLGTTINIIRSLAALTSKRLYSIGLYYSSDDNRTALEDSLKILLPQFSAVGTKFKVLAKDNSNDVQVLDIIKTPVDEIDFGLTGGYSSDAGNPDEEVKALNVKYFLQLQAYFSDDGKEQYYDKAKAEWTELDPAAIKQGFYLHRSSYYHTIPALTDFDKEIIAASEFADQLVTTEFLEELITASNLNLCTVDNIAPDGIGATPLFNLSAAILQAQSESSFNAKVKKPCVLLLLDDIGNTEWNQFSLLITDPKAKEIKATGGSNTPSNVLLNWFTKNNVSGRISSLGNPDTPATSAKIKTAVNKLKNNELLVIYLGAAPQVLADYLFNTSTFPPYFNNQATAATFFNVGKPYFKYDKSIEAIRYDNPFVPDLSKDSATFAAEQLRANSKVVFTAPGAWSQIVVDNGAAGKETQIIPLTSMVNTIAYAFEGTTGTYFKNLGTFFNAEPNDKLLHGLQLYIDLITPSKDETSKLEALYKELQGQSVVNLVKDLKSGFSYDWLEKVAVTGALKITGAKATINDEKTLVKLDGITQDFSFADSSISFEFTEKEEEIITKMIFEVTTEAFALPGVQWFQFPSKTTFTTTLDPTEQVSARGELVTALKAGVEINISLKIPTEENVWAMQATFPSGGPGLDTIFQLVGGINLIEALPSQLQLLTALNLKDIGFAYNRATKSLEYISMSVGTPPENTWDLVPSVTVSELAINAFIEKPGDIKNRKTKYNFDGTFGIADGTVVITAGNSPFIVKGQMPDSSKPISIAAIIGEYLGPDFAVALPSSVSSTLITALSFGVDKPANMYNFATAVSTDWPIEILGTTLFTITGLAFSITAISNEIDSESEQKSPGVGTRIFPHLPAKGIETDLILADPNNKKTEITGNFSGTMVILPDSEKIGLMVSAAYGGTDAGWTFSAQQTSGQVSLLKLFTAYLPEDWKPTGEAEKTFDVLIDGLGLTIETKTNSWKFTGKTATPIKVPGTDIDINLNLNLGYNGGAADQTFGGRETIVGVADVRVLHDNGTIVPLSTLAEVEDPKKGYFGTVKADIVWQNIEITVYYDFKPDYTAFGIKWNFLEGKIVTTGTGDEKVSIATLGFTESTTIGTIVEDMVGWATGSQFSLGAPWNILDAIPLNKLQLQYNLTTKQVGLNVGIGPIELGIAKIDSITLTYKSKQPDPKNNGVQVELIGSFRWQSDPSKPLGWDAAKPETTPAPEGQGNKYLDLQLLALGQHVTYPGLTEANTVQEAIAIMKKLPKPDKDNIVIPPVTLDPNSSWLIGMDFGILRFGGDDDKKSGKKGKKGVAIVQAEKKEAAKSGYFITMQIIFNDPNLYALRIKLDGDAAKILKGLDFQILYKKISDSIGMYKAEITLPDRMRFIKMGQYNITLPVFGFEYFTNGDFQVDVGFPWKADFSRSLTFQTLIWTPVGIPIPVMGSLGIYFGKLSSATTDKVPKATNGNFNPVLVFGFGIQIGIGYEFDLGILKAGFSLTAVAIVEGVFAKFNPYPAKNEDAVVPQKDQLESSYYFWLKGTVGIIGKLYGTIDFAIIKASVDIDIRILASFTFAPYEPILLNLMASVSVKVSVSINLGLFKIKISFSFSAKINATVTINATKGDAPWKVEAGGDAFFMAPRLSRRRTFIQQSNFRTLFQSATFNWNNLTAATDKAPLIGYMTLGLTMAGDIAKTTEEQLACYVSMMFIDSVAPPQEDRTQGMEKAFGAVADSSFEVLAKTILRWAVASIQSAPVTSTEVDNLVININQFKQILNELNNQNNPTPIPDADLEAFMAGQFAFKVEGPTTEKTMNATYFPMAPAMTLSVPKYGDNYPGIDYTFKDYNKTSTAYIEYLRTYFNDLAVKVQEENNAQFKTFDLEDDNGESLGNFIFGDYFLLIARQMLQNAIDSLQEFMYFIQDGQNSNDIVAWINTNAGLQGEYKYNLAELFTDNDTVPLTVGKKLKITGSSYVVQSNDTFESIAKNALFANGFTGDELAQLNSTSSPKGTKQYTLSPKITITFAPPTDELVTLYETEPSQSLEQIATVLETTVPDLIKYGAIATTANLPLPVATLSLPAFTYTTVEGDTLQSIAAKFRVEMEQIANSENGAQTDLFDKTNNPTLEIANLTQFKVGELINEIQATQGLQHLSGMTSRYYMAGLRLPTDGIKPVKKGMWVTEGPDGLELPDFAGLYALTGQQFPIPTINDTDNFNVDFVNGGLSWLTFDNPADPTKLQISVKPKSEDATQINLVSDYAHKSRLDTGLSFLGLKGMFNTKAATYSINTEIDWNAASAFSLPVGGLPPGVPTMQLWQLPDPLTALPDLSTRKVNPRMAMKLGSYNEASRAMVSKDLENYGLASMVEFTVKKVPEVVNSPSTKTTYEVMGADGKTANVLEKIVSQIGSDNGAIQTLILAYPSDANSTTSKGIQTDDVNALTLGLAQVNLSTVTRPDAGFNAAFKTAAIETQEGMTLLNEKTTFIRLLWEASITRAGGFYLYYYNDQNKGGLPDRIFNDKNEALLSLIVIYTQPAAINLQNTIGNYMNMLVTGQPIDRRKSVLFAEANPVPNFTVPSNSSQTLNDLAYGYFGNVSQVAQDNDNLKLAEVQIVISEGTYEVGPKAPGGDLQNIANYFGIANPDDIKNANPKITSWPAVLPKYTALYLPSITINIDGKNKGGDTLGAIAKYFGMNLTALANHNKEIEGIFAGSQNIKIAGGPYITSSSVPAGNVTVEAIRPIPTAIPDTPAGADYGKIYLQNMYSLLSYQVAPNPYFSESKLGLPSSPTTEQEDSTNVSKVQVPMATTSGDDWVFKQSVPYNKFALQTPSALEDLPPQKESPYHGLGDLLQVDFAWQDLYGNRLLTQLSNPEATDKTPLNKPVILTGYNDQLIGLSKWPSVAANYEILSIDDKPNIHLSLTFDSSVYSGLISATQEDATTIKALFTDDLDTVTANNAINYTLNQDLKVTAAVLGADKRTVTLTVGQIPDNLEINLAVVNIANEAKNQVFQGVASFNNPDPNVKPTSTLLQKAMGDLQTYTQLWYQLTDPYGIGYHIKTSLLSEQIDLSDPQVNNLVQKWVASIWKFINYRAQNDPTLDVPDTPTANHPITFVIDTAKINTAEIYELKLSFSIERTGGAVMGDLESTAGIKSATNEISPYAGVSNPDQPEAPASNLLDFANNFQKALSKDGVDQLKIATGINRDEPLVTSSGNELWVIRVGLDETTSIGYQINNVDDPILFAPRPITTKLQNRTDVPIWDFDPKSGIDFDGDPTTSKDFTGIDMDNWAKIIFLAIDNNLSSEFTAAIQLVDHNKGTTYLEEMLASKESLADIIKDWMTFVFDGEQGPIQNIQESFRQQLLVKLSNAYTVKAGVQYSATVQAGAFRLFFVALNPENPKSLIIQFTSDISKTVAETISNYTANDGLTITGATLDPNNAQFVNIFLSGTPDISSTMISINKDFTDIYDKKITGDLSMSVGSGNAATPELYGNFIQNFRFIGAVPDATAPTKLILYFSVDLDEKSAKVPANYTVKGLSVTAATLDPNSSQIVLLELSGEPVIDSTTVTVGDVHSQTGLALIPPLTQTVVKEVDISKRTRNISLTAAKLNLKNSNDVPLPFLISAPQIVRDESNAIIPYINLDTSFESNSIEHQIGTLPNIADYRASTWLNFIDQPEALDADLGLTKVPLILRSFPATPSMISQDSKIFQGEVKNINDILKWSYLINYAQTVHYPQDELFFEVIFNVQDNMILARASFEDAFNQIAEFITVYPEVEKVFQSELISIDATTKDQSIFDGAAIALESYNKMVDRIIAGTQNNAFRMTDMTTDTVGTGAEPYIFQLQEGVGTVGTETAALVITIFGTPPLGIGIPSVTIPNYKTKLYDGPCKGDYCYYFEDDNGPLPASVGQEIGPRCITLPDMNILARQDAETTVELKRNVDLVPGKDTSQDFIYTTGSVGYADPFHPMIPYDRPINIATITGQEVKTTLKLQLTSLFAELLKENTQKTASFLMTSTFNYSTNAALDPIELPVMMQPLQSFIVKEDGAGDAAEKTLEQMIESWNGYILDWIKNHNTGGLPLSSLNFNLTIFSNLTKVPTPLVQLESLYLDLSMITDVPVG